MKISSGNFKVLDTGLAITYKGESLLFDLGPELKIMISFSIDEQKPGFRIDLSSDAPNRLILNCINADDGGLKHPIKIGNIGSEDVYVIFWITNLVSGSISKKVEYTWYLGKDENGD